jgi:hypothetical protein
MQCMNMEFSANVLCARFLASLGKCAAAHHALSSNPNTALVIVDALRLLDGADSTKSSSPHLQLQTRRGNADILNDAIRCNFLTALAAAAASPSSQHALLSFPYNITTKTNKFAAPYDVITRSICRALKHLGKNDRDLQCSQALPDSDNQETQKNTFDLLQAACEVLGCLASYGVSARNMLATAGAVDICLSVVTAIRSYAACQNDKTLGEDALVAAVATLQQVSIAQKRADPLSLRGIPIVYDVLRSHVSRPSIQQHGIQLMHILGQTHEGAMQLDYIPGSWRWLGKTQFTKRLEGHLPSSAIQHLDGPCRWNATQLAAYLNLRGLREISCIKLQHNLQELRKLALLPFESESSSAWKMRMLVFERQIHIKFLGIIS